MSATVLKGRVWRFGDNIDTDNMAPWATIGATFEQRRPGIFPGRPEFVSGVQPGDVIVAGKNWGCGSSREQAPENLRLLGVAVVVAESFGRIYFRNAIATGFAHVACPGVAAVFADGDELEVDVRTALVRNTTTGFELQGQRWTDEMAAIVAAGGLLEVLKLRLGGLAVVEERP